MPANTCSASAICGTHFGLTKAETSMTGRFAALSLSTNAILSTVETVADSFCNPSRGPTSTTRTFIRGLSFQLDEGAIRLDELALAAIDRLDRRVARRANGQLHLHRLDDDESVAAADGLTGRDEHFDDRCRHRRRHKVVSAFRRTVMRPLAVNLSAGECPQIARRARDVDDGLLPLVLHSIRARPEALYCRHDDNASQGSTRGSRLGA